MAHTLLPNTLEEEARKTLVQQLLGPRGGLFALGTFVGAACMYYFLTNTIIKENKAHYEAQIAQLNSRVEKLEAENL
ncbi:MAG: hypothetical protein HKO02_04465, partial [Hyphomonadaceae bacterium]|nr:hypothetical protein [Hyphomonadaceae bacterium]